VEKDKRVLKGRGAEGLSKAKKDILGAFAVAERLVGVLDSVLGAPDDDEEDDEERPEPARETRKAAPQKVDAIVVGKKADGTLQIVLNEPRAVVRRR